MAGRRRGKSTARGEHLSNRQLLPRARRTELHPARQHSDCALALLPTHSPLRRQPSDAGSHLASPHDQPSPPSCLPRLQLTLRAFPWQRDSWATTFHHTTVTRARPPLPRDKLRWGERKAHNNSPAQLRAPRPFQKGPLSPPVLLALADCTTLSVERKEPPLCFLWVFQTSILRCVPSLFKTLHCNN